MNSILKQSISSLYYFTTSDVEKFLESKNTNVYLTRYLDRGEIIRLKRGIYVSQEVIKMIQNRHQFTSYLEYITTNVLISPSYLSCEYILATQGILIENVYAITAVTTKKTTTITNHFGQFFYQNLDEKLFWGYSLKKEGDVISLHAYPEKALLDWIWLKKDLILSLDYFKELRLNLEPLRFVRLKSFAKKYNKAKVRKAFLLLNELKGL